MRKKKKEYKNKSCSPKTKRKTTRKPKVKNCFSYELLREISLLSIIGQGIRPDSVAWWIPTVRSGIIPTGSIPEIFDPL